MNVHISKEAKQRDPEDEEDAIPHEDEWNAMDEGH
jgi:hypothetical protein